MAKGDKLWGEVEGDEGKGDKLFPEEEGKVLNEAIDRCFEICDKYHVAIYHLALQIVKTIE